MEVAKLRRMHRSSPNASPGTTATPAVWSRCSAKVDEPVIRPASLLELLNHDGDRSLWAVQGFDPRLLGDGIGVGGRLALEIADGPDELPRAGGIPETPASHRIGFGESIDQNRQFGRFLHQLNDAGVRLSIE